MTAADTIALSTTMDAAVSAPAPAVEPVKVEAAPAQVEPVKTEPTKVEAAPVEAAPATPAVEPQALETALHELRRLEFSQKQIDAMAPQELVAVGSKLAALRREKDDNFRQLSELKKAKPEEIRQDPNSAGTPQASTLFAGLVSEFGEEATAKLRAEVVGALDAQAKAYKAEIDTLRAAYEPLVKDHAQAQLNAARQRLTSKYEQLKDDAAFSKVYEKMSAWGGAGYTSLDAMIDDASRIVFADEMAKKVAADLVKTASVDRQRDAGQLLDGQTSNRDVKRISDPYERGREVMRLLQEGKSPEEIRSILET